MIKERAERICQEGFTRAKHGWLGVMTTVHKREWGWNAGAPGAGCGEGEEIHLREVRGDRTRSLAGCVAGEACSEWAGTGAVERAPPITGHHWTSLGGSLGITVNIRHHWAPLDTTLLRSTRHAGIIENQWALLDTTGDHCM